MDVSLFSAYSAALAQVNETRYFVLCVGEKIIILELDW
jgi:hypothetical protein